MKTLAALAALTALSFVPQALAGTAHGSSNSTGGVYANETGRIIISPAVTKSIFGGGNPQIQIQQDSSQPVFSTYSFNNAAAPALNIGVSGGILGAYGLPDASYCCGGVYWKNNDGSTERTVASVSVALAATATSGNLGNKLLFRNTLSNTTSQAIAATIDASGRWIVNTLGYVPAVAGYYPKMYVSSLASEATIGGMRYTDDTGGAMLVMGKSRATTDGTNTAVTTGDTLAQIIASGADGTTNRLSSGIDFTSTGTIATNQVPGIIDLWTASATGVKIRAVRIDEAQQVGVNTNTAAIAATLDVNGYAKLKTNSSAPVACSATYRGSIAYTGGTTQYLCFCDGSAWQQVHSPATACTW